MSESATFICEDGNELKSFVNEREFLDKPSDHNFLNKHFIS
jgi:hypothetical protein